MRAIFGAGALGPRTLQKELGLPSGVVPFSLYRGRSRFGGLGIQ